MFGFLFDSELRQHVRLSILFWTWAAWSAFYLQVGQLGRLSILNLDSIVRFLLTSWTAWSALYSELGQHGFYGLGSMVFLFYSELGQRCLLSIYNLGSVVGFLFTSWAAWSAFYSILNLGSMVGFLFDSELGQHGRLSIRF